MQDQREPAVRHIRRTAPHYLPCTNFRGAYDERAHLVDIDAVPYLGCGARDVAVARANSDAVLDSPLTAVAWPAGKLAMFGLLSGVRAHFGRCVVSRSRLGELP